MNIGILGGGQLGKMFLENAYNYPYTYYIMDNAQSTCQDMCQNFVVGDIKNYDDVLNFGMQMDVIGIEIENVNLDALKALQGLGKKVIPDPSALEIFKDKGIQKKFYQDHLIPTAPFEIREEWNDLQLSLPYPVFQKYRIGGYDGKGVVKIDNQDDLRQAYRVPSVFEQAADLGKELAIIACQDQYGNTFIYPPTEFVADHQLHLLDYLIFPAKIEDMLWYKLEGTARTILKILNSPGIFAIEFLINKNGTFWVNEIAPRVHNSGHTTIEASSSSQFDQMLRILAGLHIADAQTRSLSAMWNIVAPADVQGAYSIEGLDEVLTLPYTYLHWYKKSEARAGRKMGHLTFLGNDMNELQKKINFAKANLKIKQQ